ncbi:MAG: nicotinate (nicotinamide) nucleotide adenylyltransferase [Micavibrio aeruginosavorus]|uniref:Probable nicotinate-nucleotide adenylyltransferase n=1 Tax=Micavibrio aeruginosavorus TaxID=349221 RepID=A0A2W5MUH2_9BACT|nr:MAG: nicotinate (nicotinamide) nucleotide adenylyltransferase [Micavibrio aeruginosavorus]
MRADLSAFGNCARSNIKFWGMGKSALNMKSIFTPPRLKESQRWNGLKIGLLGGSFNPAHEGHLHIAQLAIAKLGLDFVWWLVTPQNPLKKFKGMAPYQERFESVEKIIAGRPRMMATHLENELGTTYTYETVRHLKQAFPKTDFTFICGMDNALIFHKWDRWKPLARLLPIAFIARPPAASLVRNCPIRMVHSPDLYWLKTTRMLDISSTQIRNSSKIKKIA